MQEKTPKPLFVDAGEFSLVEGCGRGATQDAEREIGRPTFEPSTDQTAETFRHQHGETVRFLTGRAARSPDANGELTFAETLGEPIGDQAQRGRFAKKSGVVDRAQVDQELLRRTLFAAASDLDKERGETALAGFLKMRLQPRAKKSQAVRREFHLHLVAEVPRDRVEVNVGPGFDSPLERSSGMDLRLLS